MMKRFLYLTVVIFILGFGFGRPAAARAQLPASHLPAPAPAFSGRVYEGATGVEPPASKPIEGVTVSLYCSQNQNEPGELLRQAVTDAHGWYSLPLGDEACEFYNIVETDPEGYVSRGATTVDGHVIDANRIQYALPLAGKTLTGNKFWDVRNESDIPLADVPRESHRLAAQLIEDMRGGDLAPGWEDAVLGPIVRPLYRPDLDCTAYYEFQVLVENEPAGFIIVSTGDHDFPIAHWNFTGEPPSRELERKAEEKGIHAARFYKLDALDYAAEDESGEQVVPLGTLPLKVSDMNPDWLNEPAVLSSSTWIPDRETEDDTNPPQGGEFRRTGPQDSPIKLGAWESWQALKDGYADAYGVLLEDLHRDAREEWEIEQLAREYGEGLARGESRTLALLCENPDISLEGPGAPLVETELLPRPGGHPAYKIMAMDAVWGQEMPLNVIVRCPEQEPETLRFVIIEAPKVTYLPMIQQQAAAASYQGALLQPLGVTGVQSWGWYWAWAGTKEQTMYHQLPFYPPPTISSCSSGCGATAWAMLFGWADHQAQNPNWTYWHPRWGIFRLNGGYGVNVRAPLHMDQGVMNMTWELRARIGTWCISSNAPTFPWKMDGAANYLKGRTGTKLTTHYNVLGIRESRLRRYARNAIIYRKTPAVIGTGWLKHYPLAYGYYWRSRRVRKCILFWCWKKTKYNRYFWVNQGWGGSGNGWVPARTWFAGEIYP
jgi:hypothetical protein